MKTNNLENTSHTIRRVVSVISRITFSLVLWTLGAANMNLTVAQMSDHHVVRGLEVDRAKVENLHAG